MVRTCGVMLVMLGCGASPPPALPPSTVVVDAGVIATERVSPPPVPDAAPAPPPDAAPAPPPAVDVAFTIAPRVGTRPPVLLAVVRNPTDVAVPFARFADPACFAHFYLSIELTVAGKPRTARPCAYRTWPGERGDLAPGTEAKIELPFAKLFAGPWPAGAYPVEVDWDPGELAAVQRELAIFARQRSLAGAPFAIAKAATTFRIARGADRALPGGIRLTFLGHGHKHVAAGGPASPLIIHAQIARGTTKEEVSASVHPDDGPLFWLDDLAFELVRYEYDGWMELRFFGKVVLDP